MKNEECKDVVKLLSYIVKLKSVTCFNSVCGVDVSGLMFYTRPLEVGDKS